MNLNKFSNILGFGSFKGMFMYLLFLISFLLIGVMIYKSQKNK